MRSHCFRIVDLKEMEAASTRKQIWQMWGL